MAEPTFDDRLAAAQSGDEVAFTALWRELNPKLVRYLRVLAPSMCDDLASETWLNVMRSLGKFSGDESGFTSWVFTIARNKLTDWHRHEARRPADSLDDSTAQDVAADDDTELAALEHLSTEAALALIASLPKDQAEIVVLRVVAALDVVDVARIVKKSPGAVRVSSHRALRTLHAEFAARAAATTSERL
ncbi:MAG: polymerase sigma-70 factor, subfamily [Actinomycetota bacterium]|jgi:RNA polymerase sigma-70 factor (ECF subfamily)|nr:polymerase sigma-70 factor, subfamily [Actinomycetota bacterium]